MKCKLLLLGAVLGLSAVANAERYSSLWSPVSGPVPSKGEMALHPDHYLAFSASETSLSGALSTASSSADAPSVIDLPQPDGTYRAFRIWKNDLLPEALAAKYPGIYTLTAEAVDNRSVTAKIDYTPYGFHAYVFNGAKSYLIDPYSKAADGYYIAYYRSDYTRPVSARMACGVEADGKAAGEIDMTPDGLPQMRLYGTTKKKYRLALAADYEYSAAVTGSSTPTKAAVLAKMVVSVNRVVGVYEREFAVTMALVPNDDTLIYITTTDPYTNNNGGTMLGQNQIAVDTRIGTANYDIGHVFSTGGGGIASLGCVCHSNNKAQGVTGSTSPVGDSYDIDYVAHEMGHQFGGNHTFNANTGSCSGNGVSSVAYEPASGSTIMAYAGICSPNDYTQHSDAYFHSASLEEITTNINSANGSLSCAVTSTSTNTNATVPAFTAIHAIPYKTPFELTAPTATDATADTLTYCWEQRNLGDFHSALSATYFKGPIFRSFSPTTSRTRVFPTISYVVNGIIAYNAEKLPDTARYLTFKMTERDVYQGFGTFNFPDDTVHLDVINTTVPFTVISPSGSVWSGNPNQQLVTWDVASTNAAPINAANVDIFLSVDGGYTYPYTLATNVPNTGTATVAVPAAANHMAAARVKVKGSGNVFFNISPQDFSIEMYNEGVTNVAASAMASVSPNPAKNVLNIQLQSGVSSVEAGIVNTLGQKVWNGTVRGAETINVSNWAAGVYYLQMKDTKGAVATQKVVVE